ncbi:MAG: hypothetical protein ABGX04_14360 [Myxococcales bacterium]|nr:hypothetical protein [Myxococcales bacterium]HIK86746.1 hypothetical protein [Myxococcales bacterium]
MDDSGTLTMSTKELNRLEILGRVLERRLTQALYPVSEIRKTQGTPDEDSVSQWVVIPCNMHLAMRKRSESWQAQNPDPSRWVGVFA